LVTEARSKSNCGEDYLIFSKRNYMNNFFKSLERKYDLQTKQERERSDYKRNIISQNVYDKLKFESNKENLFIFKF